MRDDSNDEKWIEPGRSVDPDTGAICYAWPPEGRFKSLWERCNSDFTDEEKHELLSLLNIWRDETSTLVSITDDEGNWVDVEPKWEQLDEILKGDDGPKP